jgi:hypothetical protein
MLLLMTPVSKPSVLINLIQALCAIILGNVAYFLLAPSLPLPPPPAISVRLGVGGGLLALCCCLWADSRG